jgi:type IV secretion system protein VirB9
MRTVNIRYLLTLLPICACAVWPPYGVAAGAGVAVAKVVAQAALEGGEDHPRKKVARRAHTRPAATPELLKPQASPYDPALVVFPYDPNYIYPILTRVGLFTHVQLADGERVTGFYLSDTLRWQSHTTSARQDLFLKPTLEDIDTVGTLITTKRRYQLSFKTVDEDAAKAGKVHWYQRVSWAVGEGFYEGNAGNIENVGNVDNGGGGRMAPVMPSRIQEARTSADDIGSDSSGFAGLRAGGGVTVQVDKLNFGYAVEGDATFKPLMVFDDGRFTWIKFSPKLQDLPALFVIGQSGAAEIENFLPPPKGSDYYEIPRVLTHGALLKLGTDEVRIKNRLEHCGGLFQSACKLVFNINGG